MCLLRKLCRHYDEGERFRRNRRIIVCGYRHGAQFPRDFLTIKIPASFRAGRLPWRESSSSSAGLLKSTWHGLILKRVCLFRCSCAPCFVTCPHAQRCVNSPVSGGPMARSIAERFENSRRHAPTRCGQNGPARERRAAAHRNPSKRRPFEQRPSQESGPICVFGGCRGLLSQVPAIDWENCASDE